jgi:hypothetical protein
MFNIQLYHYINDNDKELKSTIYNPDNYNYLAQEDRDNFPMLSSIDPYYAVQFESADMPQLILELKAVKLILKNSEDISHLEQAIDICEICKLDNNDIVLFNPFSPRESEWAIPMNKTFTDQ